MNKTVLCLRRAFQVFVALVLGLCHSAAHAWNVPAGLERPPYHAYRLGDAGWKPNTHGSITIQALTILRNEGHGGIADAAERNLQMIMNGLRGADWDGGRFSIRVDMPALPDWLKDVIENLFGEFRHEGSYQRNAFSHFYDPTPIHARNKGLYIGEISLCKLEFVPAPQLYVIRGPHPDAANMADWHYAKAVKAMREGRTDEAYYELGIVLHLVQDLCVPHHASNELRRNHTEFENAADMIWGRSQTRTSYGGVYNLGWLASDFVKEAARLSVPEFGRASQPLDPAGGVRGEHVQALNVVLPLAQRLSAGLLHKFHTRWRTDPYSAVKLTVNRVLARYDFDSVGQADFQAWASICSDDTRRQFGTHDLQGDHSWPYFHWIAGANDCRPADPVPAWSFPAYVSAEKAVKFRLSVSDDNTNPCTGVSTSPDHADVNPSPSAQEMYVRYNLETGLAQILHRIEDSTAHDLPRQTGTRVVFTTRGDRGFIAEITFTLEGVYVPPTGPPPPRIVR